MKKEGDIKGRKKKKVPGQPTNTRDKVQDERFSQVLRNPVYRPVPKNERKIEIDRRFQGMFKDEKFKLKYKVDKRGRPVATATEENMKRYYNLEENEEDKEEESSESEDEEEIGGDVDVKEEPEDDAEVPRKKIDKVTREKLRSKEVDYARGEADLEDESSSSDEEDSSDDGGDGGDDGGDLLEHDWGELDKDAERTEEATRRLAICNMDWDRVRAVDLMVLLSSFLPPGGVVKEVAVYPSQFGKERMAEEEREGPKELRTGGDGVKIKKEEDLEESSEEEEEKEDDGGSGEEDEEGNQYQREKLRQYQLNRLKYFYAVAEFDSAVTAEKVYSECDGMEYESSAAKVDLRFIPEEMGFEEEEPRDVCKEVPVGEKYRPRFFTTTALQQVKVDLTWDETDPLRRELTEKIFDPKEKVEDDDIRAYLATSSEEEDEEEDDDVEETKEEEVGGDKKKDKIEMYKKLLEGIEEGERKKKEGDVEMEITWGVGLKEKTEGMVRRKLEEEEKKKRTPWEEMLDKRKEKRSQRKQEKKKGGEVGGDEEESEEDGDQPFSDDEVDVDFNDEFFREELRENEVMRGSIKKEKKKGEGLEEKGEETKKKEEELELLLMEDEEEAGKKHFSLKKILEEETGSKSKKKRKWRKNKKKGEEHKEGSEGGAKDDFEIDVEDQRFTALFSSHHFNLDPSDPNFKKTKAMERIIQEKQKRRKGAGPAEKDKEVPSTSSSASTSASASAKVQSKKRRIEDGGGDGEDGGDDYSAFRFKRKAELSSLVKSVKRNTENLKMIEKQKKITKNKSYDRFKLRK